MVERGFYSEQDAAKALKELLEALEVSVGQLTRAQKKSKRNPHSNPCSEELHLVVLSVLTTVFPVSNEQRIFRD